MSRELDCTLLIDEFYSHYVWRPDLVADGGLVSAAHYVEDVDRDPVVLFDGLTKNWRYPGWRVTWTVGPRPVVEAMASAGSFLHAEIGKKRSRLLAGLRDLGFVVDLPPEGTFYVWASTEHLPREIADGMSFFRAALARKVITVPGEFFDVDPGKRRGGRASRFVKHVRFSFGPSMPRLEEALARIEALISDAARAQQG